MAMARDGLLPSFFSDVHKTTQVPVKSTIVTGICAAALAFFMDVSQLAGMVRIYQTSYLRRYMDFILSSVILMNLIRDHRSVCM